MDPELAEEKELLEAYADDVDSVEDPAVGSGRGSCVLGHGVRNKSSHAAAGALDLKPRKHATPGKME